MTRGVSFAAADKCKSLIPNLFHPPFLGPFSRNRFGTRGSEVQILSPRPNISITSARLCFFRHITVDDFVDGHVFSTLNLNWWSSARKRPRQNSY